MADSKSTLRVGGDDIGGPLFEGPSISASFSTIDEDNIPAVVEQVARMLQLRPPSAHNPAVETTHSDSSDEVPSGLLADLRSLGFKDLKTLRDVMINKATGQLMDDKTYLMERTIQLVSGLPAHSKNRVELTNAFVDQLWSTLEHPPTSYLGDKHTYRQADGSYNNIFHPQLGAAYTRYARSVQPITIQPAALPDPGLIFDALFERTKFVRHPNNLSSIFFYWATLIIHDVFQTDHRDFSVSTTSSYLDMSTLYGDTQEEQDQIRTFQDGKLKPDCFAEERLMGFPPGAGVLLIMFNRFHNYVVEQLAMINKNGRFTKPSDQLPKERAEKAWIKYDNDLFQTGRLITCGLFINITLLDFVRTKVNVSRTNSDWTLDPRVEMDHLMGKEPTARGTGNQVSAEFNLIYRWHSSVSERDEAWTEEMFKEVFGKPASELSMPEMLAGLAKWGASFDADPSKRPFGHLKRGPDGKFDDNDLVKILTESVEDVAGSFGAKNIPKNLRSVVILGIIQSRKWGLATLNEFRLFFKLKPYKTFEEVNSDPEIATSLRHMYGHPDYIEMYTGLMAEEAKPPMAPGAGLAPSRTIDRAILTDAVGLIRGDRFYTTDYNARNLTNWGYNEVDYNLAIEKGCVFYKLFLRAFPNHFRTNSIYAHQPMTIPSENRRIMRNLGREDDYDWSRPSFIAPPKPILSYKGAKSILMNQEGFRVLGVETSVELFGEPGAKFMLSGDAALHAKQKETMSKCLYYDGWQQAVKKFYEYTTLRLLREKSYKLAGINFVDITRDVGNLVHVHFAANMFDIPLKSQEHPHGLISEDDFYMATAVIFGVPFVDFEPARSFQMHLAAKSASKSLGKVIEAKVKAISAPGFISRVTSMFHEQHKILQNYGANMIKRLLDTGMSVKDVAWSQVFPVAVSMTPNQGMMFTRVLDFYLSERGRKQLPEIQRLAKQKSPEADEMLLGYAMEGLRLNSGMGIVREATISTTIDDDGRKIDVNPGDKIFASFASAGQDPVVFPNSKEVNPNRPLESYIHYSFGPHKCFGRGISQIALTVMLRTVGQLDNLRSAPGPKGELKTIPRGGSSVYMGEDRGSYFPFPLTWQVNWDGELPPLPQNY